MAERLREQQMAFAGHLRNPELVPPPGDVEDRRMAIYRRLFFNNMRALVSSAYPVVKSLYSEEAWTQLVRDFFTEHRSQSPLFPELPREFLRYLQEQRGASGTRGEEDPPFLQELAHYQWVSVALNIEAVELDEIPADRDGDLLDGIPLASPLAWPVSYSYPVEKIGKDFQPSEPPPEPTHLLVYRRRDDKVKYMRINAVSRLLLEHMQENQQAESPVSGRELLRTMAGAIGRDDPDALLDVGMQLMEDWRSRDIVLGAMHTHE